MFNLFVLMYHAQAYIITKVDVGLPLNTNYRPYTIQVLHCSSMLLHCLISVLVLSFKQKCRDVLAAAGDGRTKICWKGAYQLARQVLNLCWPTPCTWPKQGTWKIKNESHGFTEQFSMATNKTSNNAFRNLCLDNSSPSYLQYFVNPVILHP